MKAKIIAIGAAALFSCTVHAQSQSNGCVAGATNCTGSNQNSGDITNPGTSNSASTQLGNSSASIASGTVIDTRPQVTQNANNTTTGTISGGNTNSSATGGSANGNLSNNNNQSSSNSGGNVLSTGGSNSTSSVGNTSATGGAGGSGGQGGSAMQGQQQGQTASLQGGNSTSLSSSRSGDSAATGGNQRQSATGGNSASSANGAGQTTTIGGTSTSYNDNSRTIVAPWLPGTPPSNVASTQSVMAQQGCGPLVIKTQTPINGTFHGILWDSKVSQGVDEDVESPVDPAGQPKYFERLEFPDGSAALIGSQIAAFDSVNGTASARQIGIGTGGSGGGYGQGALGASSANQQQQLRLIVRPCVYAMIPAPVRVVAPQPIPAPVRMPVKHKVIRRDVPCKQG